MPPINLDSIVIVSAISWSIVVFQIITRILLEKRKQDFKFAIGNLIEQGDTLKLQISDPGIFWGNRDKYKTILQHLEEWKQTTERVVSRYDSDLLPLIVVVGNPGNFFQWIAERTDKLKALTT